MRKITQEEFIRRAREIHGERYDLSQAVYVSMKTPVVVICPEHGIFHVTPGHFICRTTPTGCPKCGRVTVADARRSNATDFVAKAREKHGDKYDYSPVVYKGTKTKVTIICPTHGPFTQTPGNHLTGFGCYACGREAVRDARAYTAEEFFALCRDAHEGEYTYPEQPYKGPNSTIRAICPTHGEFTIGARNHLWVKRRCPQCGDEAGALKRRMPAKEFFDKVREIHQGRYIYDESTYQLSTGKIDVFCSKHGWFKQTGTDHLGGNGCNRCARERQMGRWTPNTMTPELRAEKCSFYYLRLEGGDERFYKIGISNNIARRVRFIRKESGYAVTIVHRFSDTRGVCFEFEQETFAKFDMTDGYVPKRKFAGAGECFRRDVLGHDVSATVDEHEPEEI
jgi:hypothetical protein